jgi:hypothetical protein
LKYYATGPPAFDKVKFIFAYAYNVKANEEFYSKLTFNPIEKVHNSSNQLLKDLLDYSDISISDS